MLISLKAMTIGIYPDLNGMIKRSNTMGEDEYKIKHYSVSVEERNDKMRLTKGMNSDYCEINMKTNDINEGGLVIRSKNMAEQLHFMLGQMLEK